MTRTAPNTRFDRALPWAAFLHDVVMAGLAFILAMYLRVGSEAFGAYRGPLLQALLIFLPVMFIKNRLELFPRQVLLILPLVLTIFLAGPRLLYRMAKDRTAPG